MVIPHPTALKGHIGGQETETSPTGDSLLWVTTRARKIFAGEAAADQGEVLHLNKLGFAGFAYQLGYNSYLNGDSTPIEGLLRAQNLGRLALALKGEIPESPPITVYIPCYNGARYLSETIAAIKKQSHPVDRLLLIDDGSTDNSTSIANSLGVEVIRHPKNLGLAAARNTALRAAATEFIAALDADVAPHPFWLERMIAHLADRNGTAVSGRLLERHCSSAGDRWRARVMGQYHGSEMREGMLIFGFNSVGRTTELIETGGYSTKYRNSSEDADFTNRFLEAGNQTIYLPDALCWHLRQDSIHSALRTANNWRSPTFDQQGSQDSLTAMCSKWPHTVRGDIKEITALIEEGRWDIAPISFVHTFTSIICDLIRFAWGGSYQAELRSLGLQLLAASIGNIKGLGVNTRKLLSDSCEELFVDLGCANEIPEFLRTATHNGQIALAEVVASNRVALDDSVAKILFVSLSELGPVLSLPSRYMEQIELGASKLNQEVAGSIQSFGLPLGCYEHGWRPRLSGEALTTFEWCEMISGCGLDSVILNLENINPINTALNLLKLAQRAPDVAIQLVGSAKSPLLAEVVKSLPNVTVTD